MSRTFRQIDEAIERVVRLRDQLLADPFADNRAERLALLFTSEARAWSQLYEQSQVRPVWRAALAAEVSARRSAAVWRRRAALEHHTYGRYATAALAMEA